MFPPFTSTVAFLQVASVAAITLNSTFLILPDVGPSNPKNLSTPFDWRCNGADYGYDLSLESCADALSQIDSSDRAMETYGLRNPDGTGHADVNWPQRFISSDGRCVIDTLPGQGDSGFLSPQRLSFGVLYVIDECVAGAISRGGQVHDMGGDNRIWATVQSYAPRLGCGAPSMSPLVQESCQDILDTMPASAILIRFGLAGDPLASVTTPYTFMSQDRRCRMTIGTDGVTDWFNWYQIWEVGVALNGVCVRSGRSGTQARLGIRNHLDVTMTTT
ncbi:hypothetical protein MMC28_008577 [Mycoblastus sanguinarius]|nr:hypothetical protein [Mycoblastus sanguinarius]